MTLFRKTPAKEPHPQPEAPSGPPKPGPAGPSPVEGGASVKTDSPERKTANEWARTLRVNEVQAERAAMLAGRWHDLFTEEEFIELLRNTSA